MDNKSNTNIKTNELTQGIINDYTMYSKYNDVCPCIDNQILNCFSNYNMNSYIPTPNSKEHIYSNNGYLWNTGNLPYCGIPYENSLLNFDENINHSNNNNSCSRQQMSTFTSKVPIRTFNDEEYVYVNIKQYLRILQRREKRRKLNIYSRFSTAHKPKYLHESRHLHAMTRQRGKGGRFLKKNEGTININQINKEIKNENSETDSID